jgi:hypothetical protein
MLGVLFGRVPGFATFMMMNLIFPAANLSRQDPAATDPLRNHLFRLPLFWPVVRHSPTLYYTRLRLAVMWITFSRDGALYCIEQYCIEQCGLKKQKDQHSKLPEEGLANNHEKYH